MGADACGVSTAPSIIDTDAAAVVPAQLLQRLAESLEIVLLLNIFGERVEHADPPQPGRLLRACRHRPRRRAAEQRDELAAFYLIELHSVPVQRAALQITQMSKGQTAGGEMILRPRTP